jgi:pimeloyl-ACP methyl ester carboxylesterase
MHAGAIDTILFVHGYSVTDLNSFNRLPALLAADGIGAAQIYLAGFVSLDDLVSCDDLAAALESRVAILENEHQLDLTRTMLVAHSTGAIIARRWILDRRQAKARKPVISTLSHFVSAAGANHGSTLAQLGLSELAHVVRNVAERRTLGKRVLEDLDYGSAFLRRLNREWLEAWNDPADPLCADTFCFSMVGTDHSFWQNHLAWQARERGSDGTVRVGGANLNYRRIVIPPQPAPYTVEKTSRRAPHLIVETPSNRYSHTSRSTVDTANLVLGAANVFTEITHGYGNDPDPVSSVTYGIVEGILSADEQPYVAFKEAMAVHSLDAYDRLAQQWDATSAEWSRANPDETNATVVVTISDANGHLVDESLVLLRDVGGSIASVSGSLLSNQPVRNRTDPGVVSFYVNFGAFEAVHPHRIHVDAHTAEYRFTFDTSINDDHVIGANEFTYIDIDLPQGPNPTLAFYRMSDPEFLSVLNTSFPPFDPRGRI